MTIAELFKELENKEPMTAMEEAFYHAAHVTRQIRAKIIAKGNELKKVSTESNQF